MRSILDVGAEGAETECEASGTRVRSSTQSILEVLLENEFQKYKSQEDRGLHHCRYPGPGLDRAAACSIVLTESALPEGR